MKKLIFAFLLTGTIFTTHAGQVNDSTLPGYNVAAQMTGLLSACWHKHVFQFIAHDLILAEFTELLEEKCGVTLVKNKDTKVFTQPLNEKLYNTIYPYKFDTNPPYLPNDGKAEFERIKIHFGIVCSLLKARLEDNVFEGTEINAAYKVIEKLQQGIKQIDTILNYYN